MTYLELAYQVLEETQQLLWVDDIWRIAKEKGYTKKLTQTYTNEEDNINALDNVLYQEVGNHTLRLLEKKGLYYLVTIDNLAAQVETALFGPSISTYQEVIQYKKVKRFSPSKRGFDGMVLFFLFAIGFPISLYISSTIQGGFYVNIGLVISTVGLMACFLLMVLLYLQFTNCDISIHSDKIVFSRTFYPKNKILSILIKDLEGIEAFGLGTENQINSDFKSLIFTYKDGTQSISKKVRCHGYINPSPSYDPFSIVIRNFESFLTLRAILKEICVLNDIPYQEN